MGWKFLELEKYGYLKLFLNNLVFLCEQDKIIIPMHTIDVLLINNIRISLSASIINELSENNVLVIICDRKYIPSSIILPIIGNYNTLKVLESQVNWNHKWKANLWKNIIKMKISNQTKLLTNLKKNAETIKDLKIHISNVQEYDITNREGHAAKIYWSALFGNKFKRHEDDYCNILLNYGYAILRGYVIRSIIKKGLDPRIAIFHKSFTNYFALASDLMEPFRISVDCYVSHLLTKKDKNFYHDKTNIAKLFTKKILVEDQYLYFNAAVDKFIDAIVSQINLPNVGYVKYEEEH